MNEDQLAACLAAMDTQRAASDRGVGVSAISLRRLVARDRATLERHYDQDGMCHVCWALEQQWPCPDAQAIFDYWLGKTVFK